MQIEPLKLYSMKKNNHVLMLFVLAGLSIYLTNCTLKIDATCRDPEIWTYALSEETKAKVPYRKDGLDTLVFLSDAGDSTALFGQGIKTYLGREVFEERSIVCEAGTGGIYKDYEVLYVPFQGSNPNLSTVSINYLSSGVIQMCFSDKPLESFPLDYYPYESNTQMDSLYYQDTIHINTQVFTGKTYELFTNLKMVNKRFLIFYNEQLGILRIKKDGRTWNKKL
ncbi:hypothetical protein AEM51_11145 [Bacteroidetes bacterium UKL13-3]|jgi:hypothetical protein|nr:hypothetical protein AEM51_11145 [Bacteroidetes bacterium UKL13-3]HCP94538.1 hypothetical protein [Bacteroidota bacterium]